MNKLISIVVPIYNVEKYIHKCVESIINQTYTNLEIILVDDGSPDNCPKICDDYANIDSRVKAIHKENGGLSDARNAGINNATGDYIVFVDGDDYIELNMLERVLDVAQQNKSTVVIWSFFADYVDEKEELLKSVIHRHESGVFRKGEYKNILFGKELIGNLGYAWNKMYGLSFLRKHNFKFTKGLSLVEDIVFNSPVLSQSEIITFMDEPLIHYMQRPRVTLGNKFYSDYFEIKLKGLRAAENLLKAWELNENKINEISASLGFGSLKTTIRTLSKADNLSKLQKKKYLSEVFHYQIIKVILENVKLHSLKDKIICKLIQLKQGYLLLFMYKFLQR